MARADLLNILYSKERSPMEFNFEQLMCPPIYSVLPPYAIEKLHNIATSLKMASKIDKKYEAVKEIMTQFDFRYYHAGTNRVIYKHLEITNMVAKIAIDRTGMQDNPLEYKNQFELKPFVSKTFDVSPEGVIAFSERVEPITSRMEFMSIADSVYDLLTNNIIGEFVLEDIGTKFFRNWGLRKGFGPVLLDYPYLFKLDGNRLFCNKEMNPLTGELCEGNIDYDDGFNTLVCKKCGKQYQARELQKFIENHEIMFQSEDINNMIINVKKGDKVLYTTGEIDETSVIRKTKRNNKGVV